MSGFLLPAPKHVILGPVQQSQHLHLHQYCDVTGKPPILLVDYGSPFNVTDAGDHRYTVDGGHALGDLAECNQPLVQQNRRGKKGNP
jgi:hypothetical protein